MGLPSRLLSLAQAAFGAIFGTSTINVASLCGGAGTSASPYVGIDSITFAANKKYVFPLGVYTYANTVTLDRLHNIEWDLQGSTLKYTGNAEAIILTGVASGNDFFFKPYLHDGHIDGNATASVGIKTKICLNGTFARLDIYNLKNATSTGCQIQFCVGCKYDTIIIDSKYTHPGTNPLYGITTDTVDGGQVTTAVFIGCVTENCVSHGMYFKQMVSSNVIGGYSEYAGQGGSGYGIYIDSTSAANTFSSVDCEANSFGNWFIGGFYCTFTSCSSYADLPFTFAGDSNTWIGGQIQTGTPTFNAGSDNNKVIGASLSGAFSDIAGSTTNTTNTVIGNGGELAMSIRPTTKNQFHSSACSAYPGEVTELGGTTGNCTLYTDGTVYSIGKFYHVKNFGSGTWVLAATTGNIYAKDSASPVATLNILTGAQKVFYYDGAEMVEF